MTVKDELHALINQLDEPAAVTEVLAYARWLLTEGQCLTPEARRAALQELRDERPRD